MVGGQARRDLHHMRQGMRRLQRRDDSLQLAAQLKRLQRLGIGDADVFRTARVMQPGMLRPDAGIVEARADRKPFEDLPIQILQQIGPVAVQHPRTPPGQTGAMLHPVIDTLAARLDPDDVHRRIVKERMEQPHRVRPAANRRDQRVGQPPRTLLLGHLPANLAADDGLEIPHHRRVGMRPRHRADAIERIAHIGHPVAQGVVHRVLQRAATRGDRNDLGSQQLHPEHVRCLAFDVMRAHVDHAVQPELGAHRRRRHAVLPRPGFRDDPRLSHPAREDDLPQHVVDLVRAGVVQLVALHVDLGTTQMRRQPFGEIERARPPHVMLPQPVHLGPERGVGLGEFIPRLQIKDQRHQRFTDKPPAEHAEPALLVRPGHKAVDSVLGHAASPCFV